MMAHGAQITGPVEKARLSSLVKSLFAVTVMSTLLPRASLAAAAECLVNEGPVAIAGAPNWQKIVVSTQSDAATRARDCFCGLIRNLSSDRSVLGKADSFGFISRAACLSSNTWKSDLLDQATVATIGTVKSKLPTKKASTLVFNGQKQALVVRTTPPEIKRSTNYKPVSTIIGPIQDSLTPSPSDDRNMVYTIPSVPPMDKTSFPFGSHTWGLLNQFQALQRLPDGESHRMNVTTSSVLHGQDCVSGCP